VIKPAPSQSARTASPQRPAQHPPPDFKPPPTNWRSPSPHTSANPPSPIQVPVYVFLHLKYGIVTFKKLHTNILFLGRYRYRYQTHYFCFCFLILNCHKPAPPYSTCYGTGNMRYRFRNTWRQCCGSVTIFFGSGSGSHFPPSFGSGSKK
jgi:hypothetical protein